METRWTPKSRTWKAGELVVLERANTDKLEMNNRGPYEILSKDGPFEYSMREVGKSGKILQQVHADRMLPYRSELELEKKHGLVIQAQTVQGFSKECEVEKVVDEKGSIANGTKQYKVRWKGYDESNDSWVPYEDMTNCASSIQRFELKKVGVFATKGNMLAEDIYVVEVQERGRAVIAGPRAMTIQYDLSSAKTPRQMLQEICEKAGVKQEDVAFAWASPPCNTVSAANGANVSRGWHHREKNKRPRQGQAGAQARKDDKVIQKVKSILELIGKFVMENPSGGLEQMWYMMDWKNKKTVVDLCAFVWPFRKCTNLWMGNVAYEPKGTTGDGRCGAKCGQGSVNRETGLFGHYMALSCDAKKAIRGPGATSKRCMMPQVMLMEVMEQVRQEVGESKKAVLDICAGFQSLKEAAMQKGFDYVAVDIKGERRKPEEDVEGKDRAAMVMKKGEEVLLVLHRLKDGKACWTLPGGKKEEKDADWRVTAEREMEEETGIQQGQWMQQAKSIQRRQGKGNTVYFEVKLGLEALTEQEVQESFKERQEQQKIVKIKWWHREKLRHISMRREDKELLHGVED